MPSIMPAQQNTYCTLTDDYPENTWRLFYLKELGLSHYRLKMDVSDYACQPQIYLLSQVLEYRIIANIYNRTLKNSDYNFFSVLVNISVAVSYEDSHQ